MTTVWLSLHRFWSAEIFKHVRLKTLVLQNRRQEPSSNVLSTIRSLWMEWKQCSAEYLKSLTPLKKWYKIGHETRKGDLVLVSEDRVARGQWSRARVEDTHTGRDSLVRSVTLLTSSGNLTRRPVQRLHLFEACDANLAAEPNWTLWDFVEHFSWTLLNSVDELHVVMHSLHRAGGCSELKFHVYFVKGALRSYWV